MSGNGHPLLFPGHPALDSGIRHTAETGRRAKHVYKPPRTPAPGLRLALRAVAIGGFCALLAALGNLLPPGDLPANFWPTAFLALAIGWRFGRRWALPAAIGAAIPVLVATGDPLAAAQSFACTLAGPAAALGLLAKTAPVRPASDRLGALVRFAGAALLVAAPLDALAFAATAFLSGAIPASSAVGTFCGWWLVDASAMLVLTPALLALAGPPASGAERVRPGLDGSAIAAAALLCVAHIALRRLGHPGIAPFLIPACLALAAWIAARTQERTCALSLAIVTTLLFGARAITAPLATNDFLLLLVGTMVALLVQAIASDRAAALQRLSESGNDDPGTGLPNDHGMRSILSESLTRHGRPNYGLVGVQIGNLDVIHELCGLEQATAAEQGVASILLRRHAAGRAARLAPGRFALLVPCDTVREVRGIAREIYANVNGLTPPGGPASVRVQANVGGLLIEGRTLVNPDDCLLSLAETMTVSANARDPQLFVEPLSQGAIDARRERQRQVEHVRRAIRDRRLEIYAEPMSDPKAPAGTHCFEILTRLHDVRGNGTLIMPQEFIPMVAESRLTVGLDRGVVHRVFDWLASNPGALERTHRCSINLSGPTICDSGTASYIREQRHRYGIPAGKIVFEITESEAIRNPAAASRLLDELKSEGFRIALDDFGTGLSSFDYLKRFPVDYLKIDGSFIRHLLETPIDEEIVLATVRVARRIGVRTTAEHVRDQATLERLIALGVDVMQGELIGRPVPIARLFERRASDRPAHQVYSGPVLAPDFSQDRRVAR